MTLVATKKGKRLLPDLWEDFFNEPFFNAYPGFPIQGTAVSVIPDVNVIEDPENFRIELAAPGLERKDFKVEVKDGVLNISAEKEEEKKEEDKNFRRREFSFSSFSRSFMLPDNLLADRIDAKYENGILKLTLPKKEVKAAAPAKQIKVG
jgi:HSP20 family protein